MNKVIAKIFKIIGFILILLGVILTIIPMTKFDVFTYKLKSGLMFGIAFPFVGIVLIVISTIMGTMLNNNPNSTTTKNESQIAKEVKESITQEQEQKNSCTICKYCGSKVSRHQKSCPSCGAKIK